MKGNQIILNAINIAFQLFKDQASLDEEGDAFRLIYNSLYSFEVDYPIDLQNKGNDYVLKHPTTITLAFSFDEDEKKDFSKTTGLTYNAPIEITERFDMSKVSISIARRRNDGTNEKIKKILRFIVDNYDIIYIPTIRTSEQSLRIINRIVNSGLSSLRHDDEYQKAYQLIWEREQEKLTEISSKLKPIMQQFIPSVQNVILNRGRLSVRTMPRDINFFINDGNNTSIEHKGDGIKSLIQIALIKELSGSDTGLIMIEEPESHLHSGAIHELCKVLKGVSEKQQVLVTTHNSIFVNTGCIKNNHIVDHRKCTSVSSLTQIRETLGIHFSDNLFSSDCVVVVEGDTDKKVYAHLLSLASNRFKEFLDSGVISFVSTGGASKTSSFLLFMSQLLVRYFAIWDNDPEGISSHDKCSELNLIETNYRFIPTLNKRQAVLEDLISQKITIDYINQKYHLNLEYTTGKQKWSDYVICTLNSNGINIDNKDLESDKEAIADLILKNDSLEELVPIEPYRTFLKNLASSILSFFNLITN